MPSAPHFSFPLRLTGMGSFAVTEQDSSDELTDAVAICLATPQGSRAEDPDYGVPRLEFTLPPATDIAAAVEECEPRASIDIDTIIGLDGNESVTQLRVLVSEDAGEDTP